MEQLSVLRYTGTSETNGFALGVLVIHTPLTLHKCNIIYVSLPNLKQD
nr:MAG TPA: hypothetical protein [Caudoviricetes sp.]